MIRLSTPTNRPLRSTRRLSAAVRFGAALALATAVLASAAPADAAARCENGRSGVAATFLSILHPGLGEWYLNGWGPLSNAPSHKFWFGFIPFYGAPGYLQVRSAIDASNCRTGDV